MKNIVIVDIEKYNFQIDFDEDKILGFNNKDQENLTKLIQKS